MNEEEFVARREDEWRALTRLVERGSISTSRMKGAELRELVRLYRSVSEDLATVRTFSNNFELEQFLNDLVARAYSVVYAKPRGKIGGAIRAAYLEGARVFRRRFRFVLVSLLCTAIGVAAGWVLLGTRPDLRGYLVPDEELFAHWKSGEHEYRSLDESVMMAGFYSSNNPSVSIRASAVAAGSFGIGTAFMLYYNGQILGALARDCQSVGQLNHLISSIAPHGASELSGIVVSGAAGFVLGWGLIAPGRRSRGESLREAGKDGFVLMIMAVLMMFIAAPFEAFFSFNPAVPPPLKYVLAGLVFSAWVVYWGFVGRTDDEAAPETEEFTAAA